MSALRWIGTSFASGSESTRPCRSGCARIIDLMRTIIRQTVEHGLPRYTLGTLTPSATLLGSLKSPSAPRNFRDEVVVSGVVQGDAIAHFKFQTIVDPDLLR